MNQLLTYKEAAIEYGVCKRTLKRRVDDGRIGVVRVNRKLVRLRRIDLDRYFNRFYQPAREV